MAAFVQTDAPAAPTYPSAPYGQDGSSHHLTASASVPDLGAADSPASNRSALNQLGLGFLKGLGLERKTNRDGQPAKRRGPKPDSKPALTRRQELNRQAQRTHRQRKEVYIKSLEDQVMQLKEVYAGQEQARVVVEEENRKLKEILRAHGIPFPVDLQTPPGHGYGAYTSSSAVSDGGLGSGTGDYATPSSYQASGSEHGGQPGPASATSGTANGAHTPFAGPFQEQLVAQHPEENQLGIDFVLALEAGCRDHQQYLCVRSSQSADSAQPSISGHALMLSCPPSSHIESTPSEPYPHQAPPHVPVASLASLLHTARQLPWVGDGEVTPIMALNYIHMDPRYGQLRVKEFLQLQEELAEKTRCYGFGACIEEFEVRDALDNVCGHRTAERDMS